MHEARNIPWPGGHRTALGLVIHVVGTGLEGQSGNVSPPVGVDYSVTGAHALLNLLADLDMSATFAITGDALVNAPQLVTAVREGGHEVAVSRYSLSDDGTDLLALAAKAGAPDVVGGISALPGQEPLSDIPVPDADSLRTWRMSGATGDLPSLQHEPSCANMPVSPYSIDTTWLDPAHPLPPSSLLEAWSLGLAGHRATGSLMTCIVHPHIMGRPALIGTLQRFLDEAIATGDVLLSRIDHLADTWQRMSKREGVPSG